MSKFKLGQISPYRDNADDYFGVDDVCLPLGPLSNADDNEGLDWLARWLPD
jgi:hypothetical protein